MSLTASAVAYISPPKTNMVEHSLPGEFGLDSERVHDAYVTAAQMLKVGADDQARRGMITDVLFAFVAREPDLSADESSWRVALH